MTKLVSEIFNNVFERVIIPVMDEIIIEDYKKVVAGDSDFCQNEAEFIKFRGAFKQRLKLFYFRKFTQYKKEGKEKIFPGSVEQVEKDVYFLYIKFKDFLKEQRLKMDK